MKKESLLLLTLLLLPAHGNSLVSAIPSNSAISWVRTTPSALLDGSSVWGDCYQQESVQAELLQLTRALYRWYETESTLPDFCPLIREGDELAYFSLDLDKHTKRMKELRNSGLFADSFLAHYNQIVLQLHQQMLDGRLKWYIGEIPPFGNGANPWYNAQDTPDDYLQKITIEPILLEDEVATYYWSWGGDFRYQLTAVRVGEEWRIAALEGFGEW